MLYDARALEAADTVARDFPSGEQPGVFEAAAMNGLAAVHRGHSFHTWTSELAEIAAAGLHRQALCSDHPDERLFLDAVFEILSLGISPGAKTLAEFSGRWPTRRDSLTV